MSLFVLVPRIKCQPEHPKRENNSQLSRSGVGAALYNSGLLTDWNQIYEGQSFVKIKINLIDSIQKS